MTRGLRNNNPLNIRHSADRWQGARIMQTDPDYVQYKDIKWGFRAAWKILDTYCLTFKKEGKAYNVKNIIGRWAPPTENDTDAYVRAVVKLSGLGGNENMPRPKHYWNFEEVDKRVRLIRAMVCVENGIKWEKVDTKDIWKGYDLAFPDARKTKDRNPPSSNKPLDIPPARLPDEITKIGPHWDEYWDWSPQAYGK